MEACGFERVSLSFMKSYLNDRQQQVLVNNNFSFWEKIIAGVLQVPHFYVTFLWIIFFLMSQVLI